VEAHTRLSDDLVATGRVYENGYSPDLRRTGFHPLDGARYLRQAGVAEAIISLVGYRSYAPIEAEVRS
jgi:hypothetical protein